MRVSIINKNSGMFGVGVVRVEPHQYTEGFEVSVGLVGMASTRFFVTTDNPELSLPVLMGYIADSDRVVVENGTSTRIRFRISGDSPSKKILAGIERDGTFCACEGQGTQGQRSLLIFDFGGPNAD